MASFQPLALLKTRTYPAYQFMATLRLDRQPHEKCLSFVILTILSWLRQKLGTEEIPAELDLPAPQAFARVQKDKFVSYHVHEGYVLDITSLLDQGIWTLHISEPDTNLKERSAVAGRSFVTDVGLKCTDDGVILAVRINVVDPIDTPTEVEYAFRPGFMRDLFAASKLRIIQSDLLYYEQPQTVGNSHALRRMMDVLKSSNNYMPSLILTYAMEKRKVLDLVDQLDQAMGLAGEQSFRAQLSTMSLVPELLEFGNPILPYDADLLARHSFGYGRVYVIEAGQFSSFQKQIARPVQMGDMLLVNPVRFGGDVKTFPYKGGMRSDAREYGQEQALALLHSYSKHKLYDFGAVLFESSARRREMEERIRQTISSQKESDRQETEQIYKETEQLLELYEEEKNELQLELERLKTENQNLNGRIAYYDSRLNAASQPGGLLRFPDTEEFYQDEQRDLVISVLMNARNHYAQEGSRASELLTGILSENELTGSGREIFDQLKTILYRNNNVTESDLSDLRKLGFEITKGSHGHYKLVFRGQPKYTFSMPGTSSDVRALKNLYAEIAGKLSVYK